MTNSTSNKPRKPSVNNAEKALREWSPELLRKALSSPKGALHVQNLDFPSLLSRACEAMEQTPPAQERAPTDPRRSHIEQCLISVLDCRRILSAKTGSVSEEHLIELIKRGLAQASLALIPHVDFTAARSTPRAITITATAACWACSSSSPLRISDRVDLIASILKHAPPEYARWAGYGALGGDDSKIDTMSPLFIAAFEGDFAVLEAFLNSAKLDSSVFSTDVSNEGRKALSFAAMSGSCEKIRLLLNLGHSVLPCDMDGNSALCHAVINGNFEAAKLLLSAGARLVENDDGKTAFDHACLHLLYSTRFKAKSASASLEAKRSAIAFIDHLGALFGEELRDKAIENSLVNIFEKIPAEENDFLPHLREIINLIDANRFALARDECGQTLLMILATARAPSDIVVGAFHAIKGFFNIEDLSPTGLSVLSIATERRQLHLAMAIIEHGAKLPCPEKQTQLLFDLASSQHDSFALWFDHFCPHADLSATKRGLGPLCTAATNANAQAVQLLMRKCHGEVSREGLGALFYACRGPRKDPVSKARASTIDCIRLLWSPESAEQKSPFDTTVLIQAARCMPSHILKDALPILMRAPVDLSAVSIYGECARTILERYEHELLPLFDALALARREEDELAESAGMPQSSAPLSAPRSL